MKGNIRDGRAATVLAALLSLAGSLAPPAARADDAASSLPPCPPGWDGAKWADLSHRTPKYVIGRVIARYPHTPDGLKQALPQIQRAYPGTTILAGKGDVLSIPGVGVVDVIQGAGAGGKAWQWLPVDANPPPQARAAVRSAGAYARQAQSLLQQVGAAAGPTQYPWPDAGCDISLVRKIRDQINPTTGAEAFEVTKRVAWAYRKQGGGLLVKTAGSSIITWQGHSFSMGRIMYPNGHLWKVISDVGDGGKNGAECLDDGPMDVKNYVPAIDPSMP